jgi:hypothetical protein
MALGAVLHSTLDALHNPSPGPTVAAFFKSASEASGNSSRASGLRDLSDVSIERLLSEHWKSSTAYPDQESEEHAFMEACKILRYYLRSKFVPSEPVVVVALG